MPVSIKGASFLVATDLDGSLLDAGTYSFEAARPALSLLAERGIPLVLASSKTLAEMTPLTRDLPGRVSLIVENGGALHVPEGELARAPESASRQAGFWTLVFGIPRARVVEALDAIARETGVTVRPFTRLASDEMQRITGLTPAAVGLAREREFGEPFLLQDQGRIEDVRRAACRRGLRLTRGGRFWHLTGETDKGHALGALIQLYAAEGRAFTTVGLGDAANDLSLLQRVDRPVLVPGPSGELDSALREALPNAERAHAPGPVGWNLAVIAILRGDTLERGEPGE
jgi:mannosyl-3-phosphoglycerate phosphatase